jgi:hypothetical protein
MKNSMKKMLFAVIVVAGAQGFSYSFAGPADDATEYWVNKLKGVTPPISPSWIDKIARPAGNIPGATPSTPTSLADKLIKAARAAAPTSPSLPDASGKGATPSTPQGPTPPTSFNWLSHVWEGGKFLGNMYTIGNHAKSYFFPSEAEQAAALEAKERLKLIQLRSELRECLMSNGKEREKGPLGTPAACNEVAQAFGLLDKHGELARMVAISNAFNK